jgi:predicted enzyme related to lactoylglutathione lyase
MSSNVLHPPGTLTWFDVTVKDLEQARQFYGALFGWEFGPEAEPETGSYTNALLRGRTVAGLAKHDPRMMPGPPAWSVYFATDDADATAEAVKKGGGTIVMEPMDVMEHGRMAVFADPTGAHVGVWQPGAHKGAQVDNQPGAMCWAEVNTPDMAKAVTFYAGLFDLSPQKLEAEIEYTILNRGDKPVAGVLQMTKEWEGVPPHWMPYFQVSDTDASAKLAEQNGGKVSVPPFDTPWGRIAVVTGPSGEAFSIMKPAPS